MPAPLNLDPKQIAKLAEVGCTNREIADILYCSHDTLETKYIDALREGRANRKQNLRRRQYQLAMDGNPTMLIFLGKNDLGQSDKHEIEHSATPIEIVIAGAKFEPEKLTAIDAPYEELTDGNKEDCEEITAIARIL